MTLYSAFHTAAAIILLALPAPIGIPAAFVSHHFIDRWPEHGIEQSVVEEAGMHVMDLIAGAATNKLPQVVAGVVLGSGMDLIDKLLAPSIGVPANSVFDCHQDGYSSKLPSMTEAETIKANVVATGLAVLTLVCE